jgi:hypothetical protein
VKFHSETDFVKFSIAVYAARQVVTVPYTMIFNIDMLALTGATCTSDGPTHHKAHVIFKLARPMLMLCAVLEHGHTVPTSRSGDGGDSMATRCGAHNRHRLSRPPERAKN